MVNAALTQGLHLAYKEVIITLDKQNRGNVMTSPKTVGKDDLKEALHGLREAAQGVGMAAEQLEGVRKRLPLYRSLLNGDKAEPVRNVPKPSMADLVKRAHQELGR